MIIAHKDENGREQSLFNHLINVGNGSFNLGKQLDNEYISLLVGLLHDLGKADPLFQDKIMNNKKYQCKPLFSWCKIFISNLL